MGWVDTETVGGVEAALVAIRALDACRLTTQMHVRPWSRVTASELSLFEDAVIAWNVRDAAFMVGALAGTTAGSSDPSGLRGDVGDAGHAGDRTLADSAGLVRLRMEDRLPAIEEGLRLNHVSVPRSMGYEDQLAYLTNLAIETQEVVFHSALEAVDELRGETIVSPANLRAVETLLGDEAARRTAGLAERLSAWLAR